MTAITDDAAAIEQERALIGALLTWRDEVPQIGEWLRPGAFLSGLCRTLYEAILACWRDGIPADPVTVDHGLRAIDAPPEFRDPSDRLKLVIEVPEAVHAEYYARNVVAYAKQRAMVAFGQDVVAGAYQDPGFDPGAAYRAYMDAIESLSVLDEHIGPVPYADLVPAFRDRVLRSWEGKIPRLEVPTGFSRLDRALRGGFRPGDLCILAARPGAGKTAYALQVAHNISRRRQGRVVLFSAEMSTESLLWRAVAEVSGVTPEHVETGKIPMHLKEAVLEATGIMESMPVSIDDTSGVTVEQMTQRTQRLQRRDDVAAVLFDYIELAGDRLPGRQQSEELRISQISHGLKHLARTCRVPVIALCQLNRAVETRREKVPILADLRYSGALEQDADQVMFLFRHDYYVGLGQLEPDPAKAGICDVILAKHRNGATGTYSVRFHPETMSFTDLDDFTRRSSAA